MYILPFKDGIYSESSTNHSQNSNHFILKFLRPIICDIPIKCYDKHKPDKASISFMIVIMSSC